MDARRAMLGGCGMRMRRLEGCRSGWVMCVGRGLKAAMRWQQALTAQR
jgi:hypothetical protein